MDRMDTIAERIDSVLDGEDCLEVAVVLGAHWRARLRLPPLRSASGRSDLCVHGELRRLLPLN
jgi:hypothetical protein